MTLISYVPRQAIVVEFRGPTNSRGSRYIAKCEAKPRGVSVSYDHSMSWEDNCKAACQALITVMGWQDWERGEWVGGGTDKGAVFVWRDL